MRVLVTGFGPFPGAPHNPTGALVHRLTRLRRPAFSEVERIAHVFPVTYRAVDEQLPALIDRHRPDALLMFGLATRTPYLRIETRARNCVTQLWPDAAHGSVPSRMLASTKEAYRPFGPHVAKLLKVATDTGIVVKPSLNAGSYLCNYLSWRAIEATHLHDGPLLAAFIHVPLVPHLSFTAKERKSCVSFEDLVDAGEALLLTMVKLTRQAVLAQNHAESSLQI